MDGKNPTAFHGLNQIPEHTVADHTAKVAAIKLIGVSAQGRTFLHSGFPPTTNCCAEFATTFGITCPYSTVKVWRRKPISVGPQPA